MHSPTAFLRIPRVEPERQAPGRRIRHWHEYENPLPDPRAAEQGTRCMDCGVPWCHGYCPVHNQIPEWNALVSEDEWRAAWEQLESTNNFPELTGRLCPAPCEDACTLRLSGSPVTIRAIELAIIEHAWQHGWVRPQRPTAASLNAPTGQVSVVGSGPAGLACAQQLARAGHAVTVYEAAPKIGGLLRYGIPDFRLEKRILDRRLDQMRDEGVRFRTGVRVGADLPARELMTEGGVLVLACGSSTPRDVTVPGRGLGGVHFALDYLSGQNRSLDRGMDKGRHIDARDLDVVVIGGGDTGSDCVVTAIRQGARSVTQIQYHAEPPHQGDVLTHWPEPVPELKPNDHEAEGGRRIWGWETVAFRADGERVAGVDLQRLHWSRADDGGWRREPVAGESRRLPAQLVLIAIGYRHPAHGPRRRHRRTGSEPRRTRKHRRRRRRLPLEPQGRLRLRRRTARSVADRVGHPRGAPVRGVRGHLCARRQRAAASVIGRTPSGVRAEPMETDYWPLAHALPASSLHQRADAGCTLSCGFW